MSDTPSALRRLVDQAIEEHPDAPAAAMRRLHEGVSLLPGGPGDVDHFLRGAEHIVLGHLDDGAALRSLLDDASPRLAGDAVAQQALQRGRLAIELTAQLAPLQRSSLPAAERIRALYNAALALSRRGQWAAVRERMAAAEALAEAGDAAAMKAYAAITNNIAGDIRYYLRPEHRADAEKVAPMLDAARRARQAWSRAGGWMETERADYQLALCHAAAGQGEQAVAHAKACLECCEANRADACECFFAWEALARAHRSAGDAAAVQAARERMAALLQQIEEADSKSFAQQTLQALDAEAA